VTDSAHHRNDRQRPENEKEEEAHYYFQSYASSTKVKVEVVEGMEQLHKNTKP